MDERPAQNWHLTPHRSLSPTGRKALLAGTAAVGAVMAGAFAIHGLWPLIFFAAIPPLGLAFGLAASNRSAGEWQDITLDDRHLTITHFKPGWRAPYVTQIAPGWLRVETEMDNFTKDHDDLPERCNRILLKTQGKSYEIGAFLPPVEKLEFAAVLRRALHDWAHPRFDHPGTAPRAPRP